MAKTQPKTQVKAEEKKGTVVNFGFYPVRVAVFQSGERNISIKIERNYKDKEGEYKTSQNLFIEDLPKLITVLQDIVSEYGISKTEPKEY